MARPVDRVRAKDSLEFRAVPEGTSPLTTHRSGELVFYPNDAVAPWSDHLFFYRNNRGSILVLVRRLPDQPES